MADINQYMEWSKHKQTLDDLTTNESALLNILSSTHPSSPEFQETQQKVISVQNYILSTKQERKTFTQQEKIEASKPSIQKIIQQLNTRYNQYAVSEKIIDYLFTLDNRETIPKIINEAVRYSTTSYFNKSIQSSNKQPNELYLDIAQFSFLTDEKTHQKYIQTYANISTPTELKQFQQDIKDNIITKEQEIRTQLLQKYKKRNIPKNQQQLIQTPITEYTPFKEMIQDLKIITQNPSFYFQEREKIVKRIEEIQQLNTEISAPAQLEFGYINNLVNLEQKVDATEYTPTKNNHNNSLYLRENAKQYTTVHQKLKELIQHKKQEISDKVRETKETISNVIDQELSQQNPRVNAIKTHYKVIQKVREYAQLIHDDRTTLVVKMLETKIGHILAKYNSNSPNNDIKEAPIENKSPLPQETIEQKIQPEKYTLISTTATTPAQKKIIEYNQIPLNCASDILIFSRQYGIENDTSLSKLCLDLSGYTKQNKMTKTILQDRVNTFLAQQEETATISPEERQIYTNLKQAVVLYLQ